jgi:hypothetical protein
MGKAALIISGSGTAVDIVSSVIYLEEQWRELYDKREKNSNYGNINPEHSDNAPLCRMCDL